MPDLGSAAVAAEEVSQFGAGEPVGGFGQGSANVVGHRVAETVTEDVEGGSGRVVPDGQRGFEAGGGDAGFLAAGRR